MHSKIHVESLINFNLQLDTRQLDVRLSKLEDIQRIVCVTHYRGLNAILKRIFHRLIVAQNLIDAKKAVDYTFIIIYTDKLFNYGRKLYDEDSITSLAMILLFPANNGTGVGNDFRRAFKKYGVDSFGAIVQNMRQNH